MFPLLNFLNPYLLWIKIGLVVALLAFTFWAGVRWESSAVNALLLKQERMTREWQEAATQHAQAALDAQLTTRELMEKQRLALLRQAELKRQQTLRNAYEFWNAHPQDNLVISDGVVRLWRAVNGEPFAVAAPAAAATAGAPDAGAVRCTVSDLHANHEQLVAQHQALRMDFMALQAWARSAVALCNTPPLKLK